MLANSLHLDLPDGGLHGVVVRTCGGRVLHAHRRRIYGRKFGTALTLNVIAPKENANGAAIVWAVSGGWFSNHDGIQPAFVGEYLKRGYTVFAVVHGSQPKFTIPEVLEDMNRAVRFIRSRAEQYKIDPTASASPAARRGASIADAGNRRDGRQPGGQRPG